jgi:chromosomal replication initiator protein
MVSPEIYKKWFSPIVPVEIENNTIVLQVPSHFHYEWLEEHYLRVLKTVIHKHLGPNGKLKYRCLTGSGENGNPPQAVTLNSYPKPGQNHRVDSFSIDTDLEKKLPNPFIVPGIQRHHIPSNLNELLNFDNYMAGSCNEIARNAGWAISNNSPGKTPFNPFFIYSAIGLGKTHLAHAIGLQMKLNYPDKIVLYVNAELFCSQYMEAVRNNNINDFIFFYESVDVLIVDDIQFLGGGKTKTQEAFFQIFNHLHLRGKQIILTADQSPVDITGFDMRLLTRFRWGLSAPLEVPDYETRVAILNKKLEDNGVVFPSEVVDYLALRVTSSTRELEGAMITLLAQSSLSKQEITLDLARDIVEKYVKITAKQISMEYIRKIVCDSLGLTPEAISTNSRRREVAQARQMCMYLAKRHTPLSLSTIGEFYGGKHHATVLHACNTMRDLYDTDKQIKSRIDDIEKRLKNVTIH